MQKIGIRVTLRLSVGCALFGRANRFVGSVSANFVQSKIDNKRSLECKKLAFT